MRDKDDPIEVPERDPAADLRAAKERLGAWWLADYGNRSAWVEQKADGRWIVWLFYAKRSIGSGIGPTEAAAILAALEKVGG